MPWMAVYRLSSGETKDKTPVDLAQLIRDTKADGLDGLDLGMKFQWTPALVEQVRAAGLPVHLVVEGDRRELPPGVDLAAYRVVQEALTNALKHAHPAGADVAIRYGATALDLSVTNDGRVLQNGRAGHGLVGMRERVALYGGEFEAGPLPDGGYAVRATLPLSGPAQ